MSDDNFRARVLGRPAIDRGNDRTSPNTRLDRRCRVPNSRRTRYAGRSARVLYALGEDPGTVMDEMGHTDPALALRVYRQSMRRGEDEKAQLRRSWRAPKWQILADEPPKRSRRRWSARPRRRRNPAAYGYIDPSRARSSVGERSLHTREVAGSNPPRPSKKFPPRRPRHSRAATPCPSASRQRPSRLTSSRRRRSPAGRRGASRGLSRG